MAKNKRLLQGLHILASFAMTIAMLVFTFHPTAQADITSGLAGYWKFDEGAGTTTADSSGNNQTGTLVNGPRWIDGISGKAVLFSTDNSGVDIPLTGLDTVSYSLYLFPFNVGVTNQNVLMQLTTYGNPCYNLQYNTGNRMLTFRSSEGAGGSISAALPQGQWSHIVAVNDPVGNTSCLYVNGASVGTSTAMTCAQPLSNGLILGYQPSTTGRDFRGAMDELRVYNRILSAQDASALYTPGAGNNNAPVIISNTSTDILPYGSSGSLAVATGSSANCRYSTSPGVAFSAMTQNLGTSDHYAHASTVALLPGTNNFYIRCQDTASGVANPDDFIVPILEHKSCSNASDTDYYVATDGQTTNCGTINDPWTLPYAASGAEGKIKPGDTIWLREGTYDASGIYSGQISFLVSGASGAPVTFRNYNRERATFDARGVPAALNIAGEYLRLWGLEVIDSLRASVTLDPYCIFTGGNGLGVSYINMVSHDGGIGLGTGVEAYGNILYYNGHTSREHGIYWHNPYYETDGLIKDIKDNIILNASGAAIHIYGTGGGSKGTLQGFDFDGNTIINNTFLLGGGSVIDQTIVRHTYSYKGIMQFGYAISDNPSVVAQDNYFSAENTPVSFFKSFDSMTFTGNTLIATHRFVINVQGYTPGDLFPVGPYTIDYNRYYYPDPATNGGYDPFYYHLGIGGVPFSQWQADTGFDLHSTATIDRSADVVFVRPNQYEAGRANITIYNWSHANTVNVDVSGILNLGDTYELRSAQDYYGDVTTAVYSGGLISIPMTNRSVAKPLEPGWPTAASTFPEFGAFVLIRTNNGTPVLYGDVSGDGTVSAYDAALCVRIAVGTAPLGDKLKVADVSGDGNVSAYDAALIAQYAVGLIAKFPMGG